MFSPESFIMYWIIFFLENLEDYYPISVYLTYMSDIYAKNQDWEQAVSYAERSLDLAMQYGLKDQISEAYLQLHELNELQGMTEESLKNYKNHIIYRDSVTNISAVQEMANLRTNFERIRSHIYVRLSLVLKVYYHLFLIVRQALYYFVSLNSWPDSFFLLFREVSNKGGHERLNMSETCNGKIHSNAAGLH